MWHPVGVERIVVVLGMMGGLGAGIARADAPVPEPLAAVDERPIDPRVADLLNRLSRDPLTAGFPFHVTPRGRHLLLQGTVNSRLAHDEALAIARRLGIAVDDDLRIDTAAVPLRPRLVRRRPSLQPLGPPSAPPASFGPGPASGPSSPSFQRTLRRWPPGSVRGLQVVIQPGGVIILEGTVATEDQKLELGRRIGAIPGVHAVINHLRVRRTAGDRVQSAAPPSSAALPPSSAPPPPAPPSTMSTPAQSPNPAGNRPAPVVPLPPPPIPLGPARSSSSRPDSNRSTPGAAERRDSSGRGGASLEPGPSAQPSGENFAPSLIPDQRTRDQGPETSRRRSVEDFAPAGPPRPAGVEPEQTQTGSSPDSVPSRQERGRPARFLGNPTGSSPDSVPSAGDSAADAALAQRVMERVTRLMGAAGGDVQVAVHGGAVEISGTVADYAKHMALIEAVRQTPGVRHLTDSTQVQAGPPEGSNPLLHGKNATNLDDYLSYVLRQKLGRAGDDLAVRVHGTSLRVEGRVADRSTLDRLHRLVRTIPQFHGFSVQVDVGSDRSGRS